ncbi:glucosylglycerol-phosphate synthase [Streptomyces inhibens]|uniref:Glucosylglycerol-phosphate synthase n=1 Tax=Streptomyces inhibens TaxID=2293571 RepID=A0A371QBI8_STRIH|nr:trehalose-6-phosphate synthase [Streptomyces inhibens]REK91823.1 glucosylglycerol-phosphate synthase [Streptomyces inhibens]
MASLVSDEQASQEPSTARGGGDVKVLVTDLDGTLLGGDSTDRRRLRQALDRHPEVTVVFATGRSLPSIERILRQDPLVPSPRWIIADVGASVIDGTDRSHVDILQNQLRHGWPGQQRVRERLSRFPELVYQDGVAQEGRCSFFLRPEQLSEELTDAVRELGCGWTYSADRYFDVLPAPASKGNALALLARKHQWPMDSVLVAGDSLNDLSLFQLGAHGVIMSNAEPALREQLPDHGTGTSTVTGTGIGIGIGIDTIHRPDRPGAAGILSALENLGWTERPRPIVIGYHRPPVRWADGQWQQPLSPNGVLPALQGMFSTDSLDAVWATALVEDDEGPRPRAGHLHEAGLPRETGLPQETGLPLAFLPVASAQWTEYFHRACKETLWPALMSQPDRMRDSASAWRHYETFNARFADHISAHAARGATVWLHDYNLWLVPGILHAARPDLHLGLFHHTPFPPPDTFARIPAAEQLRHSLACLDWAGFHTATFAAHFRQALACARRTPRTGVHPLGIDRRAVQELARTRITPAPRHDHHGRRRPTLILSVERLDYAKAPLQKVRALATLLAETPELRGQLAFRLVCPPPEPGIRVHDTTRADLERAITDLNRLWRTENWEPVDYIPRSLSFAEVVDHYLAADVFWVTSLQDGMNLTAKEFIAAHAATGRSGVLVLSRHTGAASQLGTAALLTDPNSPEDLVNTLRRALAMTPQERSAHLTRLATLLHEDQTPARWARQIITAIGRTASVAAGTEEGSYTTDDGA